MRVIGEVERISRVRVKGLEGEGEGEGLRGEGEGE